MKRIMLSIFILLLLIGCKSEVPKEYLVGGTWVATAGYENGEAEGDPQCHTVISMTFKNNNLVYIEYPDQEFEYSFEEDKKDRVIFYSEYLSLNMRYDIKLIDDDAMAIAGVGGFEDQVCYMERQGE
ncbi:hypothetical protein [Oceanobacillus sp. 1P07AA]|uniref:hypothetical protein n=1 Tax=Oceanobacillus sp. 1P07AA TaxID=3132293 RepID=UPI0039A4015A